MAPPYRVPLRLATINPGNAMRALEPLRFAAVMQQRLDRGFGRFGTNGVCLTEGTTESERPSVAALAELILKRLPYAEDLAQSNKSGPCGGFLAIVAWRRCSPGLYSAQT